MSITAANTVAVLTDSTTLSVPVMADQLAALAAAVYLDGQPVRVQEATTSAVMSLTLLAGHVNLVSPEGIVTASWQPATLLDQIATQLLAGQDPWMRQAAEHAKHLKSVRPYAGRPRSWASLPGITEDQPSLLGWAGAKHGGWLLQHRHQEHLLGESITVAAALLLNEL